MLRAMTTNEDRYLSFSLAACVARVAPSAITEAVRLGQLVPVVPAGESRARLLRAAVEAWAAQRPRRRGGRPRKVAA